MNSLNFRLDVLVDGKIIDQFTSQKLPLLLGRSENMDLVLDFNGISRKHATLAQLSGEIYIEDMASTNGTWVNDKKIDRVMLREGDQIKLGDAVLIFRREKSLALDKEDEKPERKPIFTKKSIVILVIVGVLLLSITLFRQNKKFTSDHSNQIFPLSAVPSEVSYGQGNVQVRSYSQAQFTFKYQNGRATLHFTAGSIDFSNELEVLLNGKRICFAPLAIGTWISGISIPLPRELLNLEEKNLLVFNNTFNPPKKERWGIAQIYVTEDPLPSPNPAQARSLFLLAEKTFRAAKIHLSNRYKALNYYRQCRDFLELLSERPDIYFEALDKIKEIEQDIQSAYNLKMFTVRKAIQFNQFQLAVKTLKEITILIPDINDYRNVEARDNIEQYKEFAAEEYERKQQFQGRGNQYPGRP